MIPHSKICVTQNFSPTNSECQRKCFSKVGCGIVNVDLLAFDTTWTVNNGISKEGQIDIEVEIVTEVDDLESSKTCLCSKLELFKTRLYTLKVLLYSFLS